MRIKNLIDRLSDQLDRIKYHNESIVDWTQFLEELVDELKSLSAVELEEAYASGFDKARVMVREKVIQNAALKNRGDMINAILELEAN